MRKNLWNINDAWVIAVLQIIAIDIVLGDDNAIIIALACRNLPSTTAGIYGYHWAIILRVILVSLPPTYGNSGARLIGGILLIWIGVKLLTEVEHDLNGKVKQSSNLLTAIRTIIIADFVMSWITPGYHRCRKRRYWLVVFGLLPTYRLSFETVH